MVDEVAVLRVLALERFDIAHLSEVLRGASSMLQLARLVAIGLESTEIALAALTDYLGLVELDLLALLLVLFDDLSFEQNLTLKVLNQLAVVVLDLFMQPLIVERLQEVASLELLEVV